MVGGYLLPVQIFDTEFTESLEVKVDCLNFPFSSVAFWDRFLLIRVCPFLTLGFGKRANLADAFSYQKLFVNAS